MHSAFSALCDVYCHFNAPSYKISLLRPEKASTISDYHDARKKKDSSHVQLTSYSHTGCLLVCEIGSKE